MHAKNPQSDRVLFMLGCTHRTADIQTREQLALSHSDVHFLYKKLLANKKICELLILNTCNRIEIYCVADPFLHPDTLIRAFSEVKNQSPNAILPHIFWLTNNDVIAHIFNVATGIDSQILGETEILGQLKTAYENATQRQSTGPILNRIVQKAFQSAKWARTHTAIGQGKISIGSVCAELAARIFGDLNKTSILIVGSGDVGEKTLQSLSSLGANNITLCNRTFSRAYELSEQFKGNLIHYECFPLVVNRYDIVICSTGADGIILNYSTTKAALKKRANTPIFLIDLSLPRNICNSTASLPNTYLYNLDDLSKIANENLKSRKLEVKKCHEVFAQKIQITWKNTKLSNTNIPPIEVKQEPLEEVVNE